MATLSPFLSLAPAAFLIFLLVLLAPDTLLLQETSFLVFERCFLDLLNELHLFLDLTLELFLPLDRFVDLDLVSLGVVDPVLVLAVGSVLLQADDLVQFFVVDEQDLFICQTVVFLGNAGVPEPSGDTVANYILVVELVVLIE